MISLFNSFGIKQLNDVTSAGDGVALNPPNWLSVSRRGCLVGRTTNFTHTSTGNWQTPTWNADIWDPYDMHSLSVNTDRITVPSGFGNSGQYLAGGNVAWASSATGVRIIGIVLYDSGGVAKWSHSDHDDSLITGGNHNSTTFFYPDVDETDYFILRLWQGSGGNLGTISSTVNMSFWCLKLS